MQIKQYLGLAVLLPVTLTACISDKISGVKKTSDYNLTCAQLEWQMKDADSFRRDALRDKDITMMSGLDPKAPVTWTTLDRNYYHVSDAIRDADMRKEWLASLYEKQGCSK